MSLSNNGTIEIASGDSTGTPTEGSPLLIVDSTTTSENASPAGSETTALAQTLWEEMNHPWPSTFQRSISILASPGVPAKDAALFTKSPEPGSTPLAFAHRDNLRRGFYTPNQGTVIPPFRTGEQGDASHAGIMGTTSKLTKVKSLDFKLDPSNVRKVQVQQQKKVREAQEYRAKILKEHDAQDSVKSPGYGREMASTRMKKQQKQAAAVAGPDKHDAKATFTQCAFNLCNILMGVGLLGLPFVFKSAGWYGGSFCLVIFGFITWRTSILIGRELNGDPRPSHYFDDSPFKSPLPPGSGPEARMLPPITSFPDIARVAFGDAGCYVLATILYFELFSCICVFFVTIGDHLHQLFPTIPASYHMAVVAALSMIPTILLRTPKLLSYLSMVGTVATIAVVLSVFSAALGEGEVAETVALAEGIQDARPYHIGWRTEGLALAFGLVAYCFSGHAIVPSIYTSMAKPQEFERMVTVSFVTVILACFVVAMSGYYMFGSVVEDQVTLSLEQSAKGGIAMKLLTWLMILTAFSKTTLTMFPLALGIEEIVTPYLTSQRMVDAADTSIKMVLTGLALLVSLYVPSFSFLCALVGMICTMSVSVIFPAAAHLKMFGPRLTLTEKILDSLFVFVGFLMAIVGTIVTLG